MRVRAVGCLFLFILIAIGCRKPLTPNVDRNQAPETWITAAPQDTLTTRDANGNPVPPMPGTISVRFHAYWAGADADGDVVGFYWAVVETLPLPPPGFGDVPPLPGPKPQDYRFTTRTDSVFIFNVSVEADDREHAFFIYAVDNQGKPDPTPARFIFNALDRFPPIPVIDLARGCGHLYTMAAYPSYEVGRRDTCVDITEVETTANANSFPRETVPLDALLEFQWHGEPVIAGTYVSGYEYKLDGARFDRADSSVRRATYNTGVAGDVVQPGRKKFTLRVIDQAGGAEETNRRFRLNFPPDTWFSGPDPALYPPDARGERWVEVRNWNNPPEFPSSLLSCDSLLRFPVQRPHRRTFIEIWDPDGGATASGDRVYIRSEGDTVHMNSYVILHHGGYDADSPYNVKVSSVDPDLPDSAICGKWHDNSAHVLRPMGPNGSPIAFRSKIITAQDPRGSPTRVPFSNPYPTFDPVSNTRNPALSSVNLMTLSGRAYAWARAWDGNDQEDETVADGRVLADRVDGGIGTPDEVANRHKVIAFYVNKAPALLFNQGGFSPRHNQVFATRNLTFNLLADDVDPYDPLTAPGRPSSSKTLRWKVWVLGKYASGDTAIYRATLDPAAGTDSTFTPQLSFDLPSRVLPQDGISRYTVRVQLCDCSTCESSNGQGRCVTYDIPIEVRSSSLGRATPEPSSGRPGPGPSEEGNRSAKR